MKSCFSVFLVAFFLALTACGPSTRPARQAPDTSRLDDMARSDSRLVNFAGSVKAFYEALRDKNWPTTYEMRTATFKHDVAKELYLKETAKDGKNWSLDSYKVLKVESFSGTNGIYAVQLIMEFDEGGMISYASTWWKNEEGAWTCEEPGLSKLPLLHSTRSPDYH